MSDDYEPIAITTPTATVRTKPDDLVISEADRADAARRGIHAMWYGIVGLYLLLMPFVAAATAPSPAVAIGMVICWVCALVCGIVAIVAAVRVRREWASGTATAGLVTGIIGVALTGLVLVSILFSSLAVYSEMNGKH